VHGDFHAGNILIEARNDPIIWLIDFPHTHIGPTIQDIARLEADIKFSLFYKEFLLDKQVFDAILDFEDYLLGQSSRESLDLSGRSQLITNNISERVKQELDRVWQSLTVLRSPVRKKNLIPSDPSPYYLALLHATLPVLYFSDRSPEQKLYAFISAALLCERLGGRT
jgi:hypothetical protein